MRLTEADEALNESYEAVLKEIEKVIHEYLCFSTPGIKQVYILERVLLDSIAAL